MDRTKADLSAPNFDPLARVYRWMEAFSFGPWLWWCRCTWLGALRGRQQVLILGDGDGRFTARLLRDTPHLQVHALDISPGMLGVLRRRVGLNAGSLRTEVADLRTWKPDPEGPLYDAVVTHFLLDCLTTGEVEALASRLRARLTHDAVWVISEFAVPQGWFGRLVARPLVASLYRAFGLLTGLRVRRLPAYASALETAGFRRSQARGRLGGLLAAEAWVLERAPFPSG